MKDELKEGYRIFEKISPKNHRVCLCTGCGRIFGGVSGFDKHQRLKGGKIHCLDPSGLGMVEKDKIWRQKYPSQPRETPK